MSIESPGTGRAVIENFGNELKITIPVRKQMFLFVFPILWIGMSVFMYNQISNQENPSPEGFIAYFIFTVCLGGITMLLSFMWNAFGKEIISIDGNNMNVKRYLFSIGLKKEYDLSRCKGFRILEESPTKNNLSIYYNENRRILAFDYGLKTIRFGMGLDEAEGRYILEKMSQNSMVNLQ